MKSIFFLAILATSFSAFSYDSYLVKFKNAQAQENFAHQKSSLVSDIEDLQIAGTSLGLVHKMDKATDELFVKRLKAMSGVELVEPNYKLHIVKAAPNPVSDPMYTNQWGLFGKESINAPMAWEITKGSKDMKIAVIDTGVDYTHPDLKSQMWVNDAEKNGQSGVDDDGNGFVDDVYGYDFANNDGDPMDDNEHGTHCSGIIGAAHNSIGVAGTMANVQIMAIKFLKGNGSGDSVGAIKSIDYAIKMGANVMSNSWGGEADEDSKLLEEAIERARDHGIAFIAAAGNDSSNNDSKHNYPSDYETDNIIAVGSHDSSGAKSYFSNYGKTTIDVFAPGSNILSTVPGGKYAKLSGTSMATPYVAGVVGLLLSQYPQMTYQEIKERLIKTSVKNGKLDRFSVSGGRIDAYRALENIQN